MENQDGVHSLSWTTDQIKAIAQQLHMKLEEIK